MNKEFKTEELLSFSEVVEELKELLENSSPDYLTKLYNNMISSYTELNYEEDSIFTKTTYDQVNPNENSIVVGAYYELPDGRITRTYGSNSIKRIISHYFDEEDSYLETEFPETKNWKKREDLRDFPNAKDPKLPYEFDLNWDIKYESELMTILSDHSLGWLEHEGVLKALKKYPELHKKFINLIP